MSRFDELNDPDARLDRTLDDIRNEPIDNGAADQAAARAWMRIASEARAQAEAPGGAAASDAAVTSADLESHTIEGCAGYQKLIPAFVAGALPSSRAALIEDHTSECVACRRALLAARSVKPSSRLAPSPFGPAAEGRGKSRPRYLTWGLAAAAVLTIAVAGIGAMRGFRFFGNAGQAQVHSLNGTLYRVSVSGTAPLAQGDSVRYGEGIRTARGSEAVVQLADGSLVELAERSEINVSSGARDTTITLPRGNIIVQAAHRSSGHLFVASGDAMVSVTGTIFSVNHGTKGSRVSVIEGEVHVDHGGQETVLHPGDQVSTNASMSLIPVPEEIAWSQNVDRYLALMQEMASVRRDLNQVHSPAPRYSTELLDSMPAGLVVYAAIPNITGTLQEANRRIEGHIAQSTVLRDWFADHRKGRGGEAVLHQIVSQIHSFGGELGDEIVVGVQMDPAGRFGGVLLMSNLKNPAGFRSILEKEVARANAPAAAGRHAGSANDAGLQVRMRGPHDGDHNGPRLQILPDTLDPREMQRLSAARASRAGAHESLQDGERGGSSDEAADLLLWVHGGRFIVASAPELIQQVAAIQDGAQADTFKGTPFHDQIAEAYRDGAGWLFSVDIQGLLAHALSESAANPGSGPSEAALRQAGILDAQQFIFEVTETGERTQTRGVLTFDKPRQGLASWLAAPAPMGSLAFMSPDATLVSAFVVKQPVQMVDDLFALLAVASPEGANHIQTFESESGMSLREDLAASFGGEFAFATDGPALPVPAWKAVFEVYDAPRLQQSIERLVQKVNEHIDSLGPDADAPHGRLSLQSAESGGRTYYSIGAEGGLSASYVFVDGYLLVASKRELLDRAIQNRAAGYVLANSPVFRGLLPQDGQTNFSALVYQNLGNLLGPMAERLAGSTALTPQQQESIRQLGADAPATLTYAYGEENRIVFATNGDGTIASFLGGAMGLGGGAPLLK